MNGALPVVPGEVYHLVFNQIDPDPVSNYVGLDLLYQHNPELGPRPPISNWGVTVRERGSPWEEFTERFGGQLYTPILSIHMDDGYIFGNGYIEAFPEPSSYRPINGDASIQVEFEPTEEFIATRWWLRALRATDTDQGVLRARLEGSDGLSEVIEVPASEFVFGNMTWIEWPWEVTFAAGIEYVLTLTGDQGAAFELFPLRQGTTYNFETGSVFGGISRPSDGNGGYEGWHKDQGDESFIEADIMMAWTP